MYTFIPHRLIYFKPQIQYLRKLEYCENYMTSTCIRKYIFHLHTASSYVLIHLYLSISNP